MLWIAMHKTKHIDRTKLTSREAEVLTLLEQGFTYEQIAEKLHISEGNVKNRICSINNRQRAKGHLSGQ